MGFHVLREFAEQAPAIEALAVSDSDFAKLLTDYEELKTWLAVKRRQETQNREEIAHTLELVRELEQEIRQQLEKRHGDER